MSIPYKPAIYMTLTNEPFLPTRLIYEIYAQLLQEKKIQFSSKPKANDSGAG